MKVTYVAQKSANTTNLVVTVKDNNKTEVFTKNISSSKTSDFIKELETSKTVQEIKRMFGIIEKDRSKKYCSGIVERNGKYFWNSDVPLPDRFLTEILRYKKEGISIQPLENFWALLEKAPDPHVRDYAMRFIADSNLALTPGGCFISYRNIVDKNHNRIESPKEIISREFLASLYKKDLSEKALFILNQGGEYSVEHVDFKDGLYVSSLKDAYMNYVINAIEDKELAFTDSHTRKQVIRIGQDYSIDRNLCDPNPNESCSAGLHLGSERFIHSSFGNTTVTCLIAPFDIVCVPHGYADSSKIRVCSMFILGKSEVKNGRVVPFDPGVYPDLKQIEKEYITRRLEVLKRTAMYIGDTTNSFGIRTIPDYIRNNAEYIKQLTSFQTEVTNREVKGYE